VKTATYLDAVQIGGILDLDINTVWEIIKGMKLEIVSISCDGSRIQEEGYTELVKAVEDALSESADRTE
jgi:hypothetical protein